ncbi:MAG: hypothetical protein H6697_12675 [Myxococcales bacterium]|nr:hypothetical protein [Myxococcales bacterium]
MAARRERLNKELLFEDLGYEPHEGQRKIHASRAPRRVVACGVRWGKTLCAAMEGIAAALEPRERSIGWVVAPTYDLADKVFREILEIVGRKLRHRIVALREGDRRLILRNMLGGLSEVRAKSADNPVSLLGEGLDYVIVDEAARLKPAIWQGHLSQRLLDKRGWALLISTPKGKGWLYELFRRGLGDDESFASWNSPSWENPYLDRALIDEERTRLPERVFAQEYGAQFLEGAGAVFRNVRDCATGTWGAPKVGMDYYGGLDLARVEDYTVLCILDRHRRLVAADRFHRIDWADQVQRIRSTMTRYHRARTRVDSTGVGDPIFEALRSAGCRVKDYRLTAASKTALIDNLALMLEQRMLTIPTPDLWPEGVEELESYEYSVSESGHVRTSSPSGQHDDTVIALALAAWSLRPSRRAPQVGRMRWRRVRGHGGWVPVPRGGSIADAIGMSRPLLPGPW